MLEKIQRKPFPIVGALVLIVVIGIIGFSQMSGNRLSGTYSLEGSGGGTYWEGERFDYVFSGNSFTRLVIDYRKENGEIVKSDIRSERKGTYSVSNEQIEFVYDDGTISASPFTRTDNTITINGRQYIKQ